MWNPLRLRRKKILTLRQYLREREQFRRFHPDQFAAEQAQTQQAALRLAKLKQGAASGKDRRA